MDRRRFLVTSLAGALVGSLAAEAQQAGKVYRIGLFHVGLDHVPMSLDGLRAGLNALGYNVGTAAVPKVSTVIEGPNIRLDWRNLADEDAALETEYETAMTGNPLIFRKTCAETRSSTLGAGASLLLLFRRVSESCGSKTGAADDQGAGLG